MHEYSVVAEDATHSVADFIPDHETGKFVILGKYERQISSNGTEEAVSCHIRKLPKFHSSEGH